MSACYFLSSVCLVPKANLGEDDKPQLHLLVQQPGLAHRKSLGVCNPPWKLRLGDFLLPSFHFICRFAADIAEPPVNELPERGSTEREATAVRSPPCSAPARGVSVGGAELTLHTPESTLCSQLLHWCGRQTATCPSWLHCYSSASLWRNWSNP